MMTVKAAPRKFAIVLALAGPAVSAAAGVEVSVQEAGRRVEVRADGRLFTAYRWGSGQKKPILYPVRTDRDLEVTRGFPLAPRPGERTDHPHHAGLWFSYGDVDGVDFWNNSDSHARSAAMGVIEHRAVRKAASGKRGLLDVELEWILPGGRPALREETRFVFSTGKRRRTIDRITRLTALGEPVVLGDSKEGLLGLRVARFLEHPEGKPVVLTGADGNPGPAVLDEAGVSGRYFTSEGKSGGEAWGTRARWAALEGRHEGQWVTVAIFDHPANPGHPTCWHARGYGLFAANPLGRRSFDEAQPKGALALARGESARFGYRVSIVSKRRSAADVEKEYRRFTREVP